MKCKVKNCPNDVNTDGIGSKSGYCPECKIKRDNEYRKKYMEKYYPENYSKFKARKGNKRKFVKMKRVKKKTEFCCNDIQRATPTKATKIINGIFRGEYIYSGGKR